LQRINWLYTTGPEAKFLAAFFALVLKVYCHLQTAPF